MRFCQTKLLFFLSYSDEDYLTKSWQAVIASFSLRVTSAKSLDSKGQIDD